MDRDLAPNAIGLAFHKALPQSIDAGAEFSFSVSLSWPQGTALRSATFRIADGEKTIQAGGLPEPAEDGGIQFTLAALHSARTPSSFSLTQ